MRRHHQGQQLSGTQQMVLADDFIESRRTNPVGQRLSSRRPSDRSKETVLCGAALCHWLEPSTAWSDG